MAPSNSPCTGYENGLGLSRRNWLGRFGMGLGSIALHNLLSRESDAARSWEQPTTKRSELQLANEATTHRPRAKRVIYLFQSGGPSQMDLFDHKPVLNKLHGQQLPDSVRKGQRLTGMSGNQSSLPLVGTPFKFQRKGRAGIPISELLPYTSQVIDECCLVKSMHTPAINHGPGVTMLQTGSQFPGRPSMGAWLSYGLGSANQTLPTFVVLVTRNKGGQPLFSRLWGSGFLPGKYQGVRFRSGPDPILYLNNPKGVDRQTRREMLDALNELHQQKLAASRDSELETRIAQYEMAFQMQSSIPEVTDFSDEPKHVLESYGPDVNKPGSYAANCLLARRLAERDVRFVQLYHPGWDQHGNLVGGIRTQCRETDQPTAALIKDLKQRGLLDDTLVVWGGEFGRTNYCQGKLSGKNFGRDHHPRCFTIWMAGGGVKPGYSYGETDDFCYNIESDPVHVHDLHATMLHLLGVDHERLTYRYQGRRFRLTDVHGNIIPQICS